MSGTLFVSFLPPGAGGGSNLPDEPATPAHTLVENTGINIQPTFNNEYKPANYPTVKALLAGLGPGLVRGQVPQDSPEALAFYEELYNDLDIAASWTTGIWVEGPLQNAEVDDPERLALRAWFAGLTANRKQMIRYLLGYNEPNGTRAYGHVVGTQPGEDWWYDLDLVQQQFIWGMVNGGVPSVTQVPGLGHVLVGGPALHDHPPGRGLTSEQRLIDDCLKIGPGFANHRPYVDVINGHRYPGGQLPSSGIDQRTGWWQAGLGVIPVLISETGYNHAMHTTFANRTPLDVVAKYIDRMVAEHLSRTSGTSVPNVVEWFELLDNAPPNSTNIQNFYGIVTVGDTNNVNTWSATAAYHTLANMLSLFRDPGIPYTPDPMGMMVTPGEGTSASEFNTLKYQLFGKRDGSYQLSMWRDLKIWNTQTQTETDWPGVNIVVALESVKDITVYRPSQQQDPIAVGTSDEVIVSIDEQLVVLDIAA